MVSAVGICNMALGHIRHPNTIQTIGENSAAGRAAALWYDPSRQQVLEASNWGFARKRLALAAHSEDPPDEWAYRYQYPAGCLVFRRIVNPLGRNAPAQPYRVELDSTDESQSILTNVPDAYGEFTTDQDFAGIFSPLFVSCFSHLLAHHFAGYLTNDSKLADRQLQLYSAWERRAQASNANEDMADEARDAPWISGR